MPDPLAFNADNCSPRLISVDDAMSLTRASISTWTQSDIESAFLKEIGLDRVIAQTKEARMAGVQERSLTDLLLSRTVGFKEGKSSGAPSVIAPFSLVPRRNKVNPNYFRVSAGAATGGTSPGAHWTLTVTNGTQDADASPWVKKPNSALVNIERYFLPGHYVVIEWLGTANVSMTANMRIVSSANIDANSAYVIVAPSQTYKGDFAYGGTNDAGTNGWWESATGGQQAAYQPTTGVVQILTNSVSDFEKYGFALPGYNDYGLIDYWQQTYRWVHKYNDEYVKALEAATTSAGTKLFRTLPLAKLRAQQEKFREDEYYRTCFYGKAINENQTTALWQSLPRVYDPAWAATQGAGSTLAIEYKANTKGFRTQMDECGQVLDKQGGPLDLDQLFQAGHIAKREREGEAGISVDRVDVMTDLLKTRPAIRQLMMKYYKAKYSSDLTLFAKIGEKISFNGAVLWEYDMYDLPDYGYQLCVFSDLYFDDRVAQFQGAQKSRGRALWMIDWSDIMINLIKTMSVPRTNNLSDNLYIDVITPNVQHYLLNSQTFEVRVGNANRHQIIENFSDACPKLTVTGCDLNG
jgi:hypothetical protein